MSCQAAVVAYHKAMPRFALKALILFFCASSLSAEPIRLLHADHLESISGGRVVLLSGSVRLKHRGRLLESSFARWDRRTGVVTFEGDVVIIDTSYVISADVVVYFRRDERARARGNIEFVAADSLLRVWGGVGFYDAKDGVVVVGDEPRLEKIDTAGAKLELEAVRLVHRIDEGVSFAVDSVSATLYPAEPSGAPIKLFCDSLEYHREGDYIVAYGDVVLVQDSLVLRAPLGVLWRSRGEALLRGGVVVSDPHWTLWSDSLWVKLSGGEVTEATALGEPRGRWHDPADSLRLTQDSRFAADRMVFRFSGGRVVRADLVGQAIVDYFPAPADTSTLEYHHTSGDSVVAFLSEGRIDSVEVWGGVLGRSYRTERGRRDSIIYSGEVMGIAAAKRVHLCQNGYVRYGTLELWAGRIDFDGERKVLFAQPIASADTVRELPFLRDGKDSLRAQALQYNIESKRGRLFYGQTAAEKGFFSGERVTKARGDTFYIQNASFTTCDRKPPHYRFFTPKLKLIPHDKAIVRPMWLLVGRVPVFWLPFFVFSVKKERHSGLLSVDVGKFQKGERFIRNLGYYWAPNDYFDIYAALDIDEGEGVYIKGEARYALRYYLSGSIYGSYKLSSRRDWDEGVSVARRWEVRGSHNQNLGERAKLSANVSLVSDADYLAETYEEPEKRMDRKLRSWAAFSQGFDWGSFNLSVDRTDDLDQKTVTVYMPKLSLRKNSGKLFGEGERWYNKIYLSFSSDGVGYTYIDSLDSVDRHSGVDFDARLSLSHSIGDYVTLSPALSVSGIVLDRGTDGSKFPAMGTYSVSAGAATDLYGNIPLGVFGVRYLHHIVSPSLSFSYSPEARGRERFYSVSGLSVPSGRRSASLRIAVDQQFGLKIADSLGNITKVHLFSLSTGFSYDFVAEGRSFSDITTTLRAKPASWLETTGSMTHTLYSGSENTPSGLYLASVQLSASARHRFSIPFPNDPREAEIAVKYYISQNIKSGSLTHWLRTAIKGYATPKWRIEYDIYYDLRRGKKVSDEVRIWRDLHCWEMTFVWVPSGIRAGYYFRLNIKQLPEIKIQRSEGGVRWR